MLRRAWTRLVLLAALFLLAALARRDTKLYDLLGVSPDVDDRTLKKSYK